jgi:hypothetical protein
VWWNETHNSRTLGSSDPAVSLLLVRVVMHQMYYYHEEGIYIVDAVEPCAPPLQPALDALACSVVPGSDSDDPSRCLELARTIAQLQGVSHTIVLDATWEPV